MKLISSFLFLIVFIFQLSAQYRYEKADSIEVFRNGKKLAYPFLGGINAPQFNEIDLNQDGIMDLVISDRSGARVNPFINNGTANQVDYTYAPQYISSFPEIDNWLLTRDFNCDGKIDLLTGSNTLKAYRNVSSTSTGLRFILVGKVNSEFNKFEFGVDGTSPINPGSVDIPAIYDVDNDGDLDILFFGTTSPSLNYHKNLSIERNGACGLEFQRRSKCWGDFTESNNDGTIYLDSCRFGDMPNAEFSKLENKTENLKGAKHAGSTTTAFDLDNNGSTDLLIGDIDGTVLKALFNDDSLSPYTNSHIFKIDTSFPSYNTPIYMPIFPTAHFIDINNDNKEDMLVSTNSNFYRAFTKTKDHILYYKNNGSKENQFEYQSNENLFFDETIDLGKGSNPSFFDYNKDGLMDLIIGNHGNLDTSINELVATLSLFENTGTNIKPEFTLVTENYLDLPSYPLNLSSNIPAENVVLTFGDIDGDETDDLIIGDAAGNLHYFKDTASGNNPAAFKLESAGFENINVFENASPFLFDTNGDTLLDLVVGTAQGKVEYYPNLGDKNNPIYTLKVASILWQDGDTIRFHLEGNPKISMLEVGQRIDVNLASDSYNNVLQRIVRINESQSYIDVVNPIRSGSSRDEVTTSAIIDYSEKEWGNVDLSFLNFTRDAAPFIYEENGVQYLLVGNRGSERIRMTAVVFYDSINNASNNGTFHIADSNYLNLQEGGYIKLTGTDLNNDQLVDLAIGNDAGGFSIFYARNNVGIDDFNNRKEKTESVFELYPNPTNSQLTINIINSNKLNYNLTIRDASGKIVIEDQVLNQIQTIGVNDLSPGIYFVSLIGPNQIDSKKLIIKP